ncbi:MAG: hypothetical protein KC431_09480, partial [Myxococcales bacterium]|nr:hypothetical protein [Myxococcales bacterium]
VLELADRLRLRELRLHRISESTARLVLDHAERLVGVERIVIEDGQVEGCWPQLRERFGDRIVAVRGVFTSVDELGPERWLPHLAWRE